MNTNNTCLLAFTLIFASLAIQPVLALDAESTFAEKTAAIINKIKEEGSEKRIDMAMNLSECIKREMPLDVSADLVEQLASLLKDRDDPVRYWAAIALGNIGPKARSAIPMLEDALKNLPKEATDRISGKTSADGIRFALRKIGLGVPGNGTSSSSATPRPGK